MSTQLAETLLLSSCDNQNTDNQHQQGSLIVAQKIKNVYKCILLILKSTRSYEIKQLVYLIQIA